jgi:hypothetical protein
MTRRSTLRLLALLVLVCLATVPLVADIDYVATSNGSLIDYNTLTGAYTLLGTNATVIYGLGYSSGVLYANDSGNSPNVGFYTVNTSNGALTTVGSISGATSGTGALTAPIGRERCISLTIPTSSSQSIRALRLRLLSEHRDLQ